MKAINTEYNGYLFRSRLEARWAVFFDALGIPYEYEKEGFELGKAGLYLPDFWLPDTNNGCWVEIKGKEPHLGECDKLHALADGTSHDAFLFWGNIPQVQCSLYGLGDGHYYDLIEVDDECAYAAFPCGGGDWSYLWCQCPVCGCFGIQFEGRADRIGCQCPKSHHGDKGRNPGSPDLAAAYTAARSARFEHGAKPSL